MYSLLFQVPRFVYLSVAVALVVSDHAWWSSPAWVLVAWGPGCPRS